MKTEEFAKILNAFENNYTPLIHAGVRIVAMNQLSLDYLSEIPDFMKVSLCRKVLRFVAETALKGTLEIDGLASSCNFWEMELGELKSFGSNVEWSFDYRGQLINVTIDSKGDEVYYYDRYSKEIWHTSIPSGVHWTQFTGKIDIVRMFEDYKSGRI